MDYNKDQLKIAHTLINKAQKIVILAPDVQDPDSVSSNIALKRTLRSMGKNVRWLAAGGSSRYFDYMPGNQECEDTYTAKLRPSSVDVVILTDAGSIDQFEHGLEGRPWLTNNCSTILFDHHLIRGGKKFDAEIIGTAAATGELLYYVYQELGWQITPEIAQLMMIGLQSDTDTFSNLGVAPGAFRVAADLIELGADAGEIAEVIKESNNVSPAAFRAFNEQMGSVVFDGPVAYAYLTVEDAAAISEEADPCHYMVSMIRFVKGIKMSFIIQERTDGSFRLSMRSRHGYRASNVAKKFGGGGHSFMAGASITGYNSAKDLATEVLSITKEEILNTQNYNAQSLQLTY